MHRITGIAGGRRRSGRVRLLATVLGLTAVITASCTSGSAAPSGAAGSSASPEREPLSLVFSTEDEATDVAPGEPVTVAAEGGVLTEVTMLNPDGVEVDGELAEDGSGWTTAEPLGYGRTYTLSVAGEGDDGEERSEEITFTTVQPAQQTYVGFSPLPGETVGVGHPLAFYFSEGIPLEDKQAVEDAITITTDPEVEGAFYWFDDTRVHWRPKEYWQPGTKISIDADIYGKHFGNGVYGKQSRTSELTIGDSFIAHADGSTYQLTVEINGEVVKKFPMSLGKPDFRSWDGVHVVTEKHADYLMDSSTYGLSLDQGGYQTQVKWATRIANNGEFVHAAPWSVAQQGQEHVSHGCINLSTENAKWFYDNVKRGDVVVITDSGGRELPGDGGRGGFNDWQIPWEEWLTGGVRAG
ncbi:L,D-transpeptidase [Actinoalloteichus spitiensis]|uniref:L,D-transpeptidase n=1 Tax=Actinoalloteichus spitiensis TaxID=252394 RepID=UPI000370C262|nr:Ig-like domain-containing protein [Actinoalloteichus spitiensis]